MNKGAVALAVIFALGIGFGAGYFLSGSMPHSVFEKSQSPTPERDVLFWRNPMNPSITSPVFTQDEMGMDYLPVYAPQAVPLGDANGGADDEAAGTVTIDPVTVQNIGVRTATAERRDLSRSLNGLGRVDFNEERLTRLHPKTSGWIETLMVDETGTQVSHDTILLGIYSPELVAAQQEYLVALTNWEIVRNSGGSQMKKNARTILESARERLQLFDVPAHQIKELEKSRKIKKQLHIHSPFEGRVMNIGARQGQYVTPADELYLLADLSRIWVNVDVFEDELSWLKMGDRAEMRVRAEPGRTYQGKVTFIHPVLNSKSRAVQVRLEFDNSDLSLKPGMFASVTLFVDPQPGAVVVPSESIVRSGSREQLFVVRAPGKFEPREVMLGVSAGGWTQVLSGVEAGERVVTSSQFLIDSESKLREATAKMMNALQGSSSVAGGRTPGATEMSNSGTADMSGMHDMSMHDMEMGDAAGDEAASTPEMSDMDMDDMNMEAHSHDH